MVIINRCDRFFVLTEPEKTQRKQIKLARDKMKIKIISQLISTFERATNKRRRKTVLKEFVKVFKVSFGLGFRNPGLRFTNLYYHSFLF